MDTTNYEEDENIDKLEEIKDLMFTRDSNSKVIEQIEVVDEDDMDFLDLEDTQPVRLDVQNHRSGKIRISNRQAQADYSVVKTEKRSKNGNTTYYKKSTTVNDEKIADTCIEIFQNSNVDKMLGLDEMKEETVNQVLALFEKKGIVITDNTTNKEELLIKRKREVAYEQLLKRKIEKVASCEYQVDFDQFIEMTGIKTAQQRIGEALKVLDGVQSKNFFEWSEERLDKDFNIVRDIVKIAIIPEIRLTLDDEIAGQRDENNQLIYNTINDFRKSKIKNKRKYIKGVTLKINPSYISNLVGLESNFTDTHKKLRGDFNSSYSFRLDLLVRSIENVQNVPNLAYFTFPQLQKKFGTQYSLYKTFKARVLVPSLEDLNNFTDLDVELIEIRKDGPKSELLHVRFIIKRKLGFNKDKKFGVDKVAYYIASRIYYFTKQKIRTLIGFAKHIEKQMEGALDDLLILGSNEMAKSLSEWKKEASIAYEAETELDTLIERNKLFISQRGFMYDNKRLALVKTEIKYIDGEKTENIKLLKIGDKIISNPQESIEYLNIELRDGYSERADIFSFIPFSITTSINEDRWVEIKNMIEYGKYEDRILELIRGKKLNEFAFDNETKADIFYQHIFRGTFRQIDYEVRFLKNKYN